MAILKGTSGANKMLGGNLADTISGLSGNDTLIGNAGGEGDTLQLFTTDGWGAADMATLAGYAIYTSGNVRIAVDTDIAVSFA